jgi:hypothetical protein
MLWPIQSDREYTITASSHNRPYLPPINRNNPPQNPVACTPSALNCPVEVNNNDKADQVKCNVVLGNQETKDVGLEYTSQTSAQRTEVEEEPNSQPQQEDSESEQDAESSSETESTTDSDDSNEAGGGMDLEFELGEELGVSVWGLEDMQDDRMSGVDSDGETDAESDVDSLVGRM